MTTVTIQGIPEAVAKLGELARQVRRNALAEAAAEGLTPVLDDARRRCPVGETGQLRESLGIQVWEASEDQVELEVFSDPDIAFYGHIVEYGSRYVPAQPFLRPAFDAHKGEAERRVADILRSRIERAVV